VAARRLHEIGGQTRGPALPSGTYERKRKYTAPSKHNPAHKKSSLIGWRMKRLEITSSNEVRAMIDIESLSEALWQKHDDFSEGQL